MKKTENKIAKSVTKKVTKPATKKTVKVATKVAKNTTKVTKAPANKTTKPVAKKLGTAKADTTKKVTKSVAKKAPAITMKNTKAEILAAYTKGQKELTAKDTAKLEAQVKAKAKTLRTRNVTIKALTTDLDIVKMELSLTKGINRTLNEKTEKLIQDVEETKVAIEELMTYGEGLEKDLEAAMEEGVKDKETLKQCEKTILDLKDTVLAERATAEKAQKDLNDSKLKVADLKSKVLDLESILQSDKLGAVLGAWFEYLKSHGGYLATVATLAITFVIMAATSVYGISQLFETGSAAETASAIAGTIAYALTGIYNVGVMKGWFKS